MMVQREGLRAQSFGKTEDDAKVLAHQIAGHTNTKENHEEPFVLHGDAYRRRAKIYR